MTIFKFQRKPQNEHWTQHQLQQQQASWFILYENLFDYLRTSQPEQVGHSSIISSKYTSLCRQFFHVSSKYASLCFWRVHFNCFLHFSLLFYFILFSPLSFCSYSFCMAFVPISKKNLAILLLHLLIFGPWEETWFFNLEFDEELWFFFSLCFRVFFPQKIGFGMDFYIKILKKKISSSSIWFYIDVLWLNDGRSDIYIIYLLINNLFIYLLRCFGMCFVVNLKKIKFLK